MDRLSNLFKNRNFILLLAIFFGFLLPQAAGLTKPLVLPALALVLALSTMSISSSSILIAPRKLLLPVVVGIAMSYLVLGNFIILLSTALIKNDTLWKGFVLMAAVPPAIAIIPFSLILRGNAVYSLVGTVGAYLGGLFFLPLLVIALIGSAVIKTYDLIMIVLQLVALPLILSRLLILKGWNLKLEPLKGLITNWSFFLVLYSSVGANRDILQNFSMTLLSVALIAFASTFLLGYIIELAGRLFHIAKDILTSVVLLGTMKNYGVASGIALTFLPKESALPATLGTIFMILFVIFLDFRNRRR